MFKTLVLGNCQAPALGKLLSTVELKECEKAFHVIDVKPFYQFELSEKYFLDDLINGCDLLIYQPHFKKSWESEWRSSDYWVKNTSAKYVLSFQSLYFSAYNPELLNIRDARGVNFSGGYSDYHDKRIIQLYLEGKSEEETMNIFPYFQMNKLEVQKVYESTINQTIDREKSQNLDVCLSSYLQRGYNLNRLFHTYNHPANEVLLEVAAQIICKLELQGAKFSGKKLPELLNFDIFPIMDSVMDTIDAQFNSEQSYRIQGRYYSFGEVVKKYYEVYNLNKEFMFDYIKPNIDLSW